MPRPLTPAQIQERIQLAKAKAESQGLVFKRRTNGDFVVYCEKHSAKFNIGPTPGGPKERKFYCLECAKEASTVNSALTKRTVVDKAGSNLQKRLDQRHSKGRGNRVTILKRKDDRVKLRCLTHGIWWDDLVRVRDNMSFTCPECAKTAQKKRQRSKAAEDFFVAWENRRNPNLVLVDDQYLGSYAKHEVFCFEHRKFLTMKPNGYGFLGSYVCKDCSKKYRPLDLEQKYGKGVTSIAKIPGHAAKLRATFQKNYGTDHYMKNPAAFAEHQKRLHVSRLFDHPRLRELGCKPFHLRGYEPEVATYLLENDPKITYMGPVKPSDSTPYTKPNGEESIYHPDFVVRRSDKSRYVVEVKCGHTLCGKRNIARVNRNKFRAAEQHFKGSRSAFVFFEAEVDRKTRELTSMKFYENPASNQRLQRRMGINQ